MASLTLFAWALTRVDAGFAGRAYAAYGGIYILASLVWMWMIEGSRPGRWDVIGAAICIFGAMVRQAPLSRCGGGKINQTAPKAYFAAKNLLIIG